jgi:hypothetical protein
MEAPRNRNNGFASSDELSPAWRNTSFRRENTTMFDSDIGEDHEHSGSFAYISVPLYALRELWLSIRSRNWVPAHATIESCKRTRGGYQETIRVDVWYSYKVNGDYCTGRLIRDRGLGGVQKVVSRYPPGTDVIVRVNPADASQSYLPSGIGYLEPFLVGLVSLCAIGVLLIFLTYLALIIITSVFS